MKHSPVLSSGFAQVDYTPEVGLELLGQMTRRVSTEVRDPLMACCCVLKSDDLIVALVTLDICVAHDAFVRETQHKCEALYGIPAHCLLIHATHTHVAPGITEGIVPCQVDPEFVARVQSAILHAVGEALQCCEPVEVFAAIGHMEEMGWNRRAMFADGSSRMYGHCEMEGYIGLEGPRDPELPLLFMKNARGQIKGVLVSFASHPNCIEGELRYSADFPGEVRRVLGQTLGAQVLYFTGAAGNTAPSILDPWQPSHPWRGEAGLVRSGQFLAGEALKCIARTLKPMQNQQLALEQVEFALNWRPWPEPQAAWHPDMSNPGAKTDYYKKAQANWPELEQNNSPQMVRLNVLRIGDAAICTNSAELFVEFGLEIKQHSPAQVTFITELTDGYSGYVCTEKAYSRGGYETWPAPTSCLELGAGPQIVQQTHTMLQALFKGDD